MGKRKRHERHLEIGQELAVLSSFDKIEHIIRENIRSIIVGIGFLRIFLLAVDERAIA